MDNWGDNLVATGDEKPLYIWQKSLGVLNVMQIIAQAPDKNLLVAVSPVDQHMLLLGTVPEGQTSIDPMYVRWCDQGNYNVWETKHENTAGGVRLTQGDRIISRLQSGQNTLVWTNTSMYRIWYVGPPRTFGTQPLSQVGIIGQFAAIDYRGVAYWMTHRGFYQYNGTVNNIPCDVRKYVIANMDPDNAYRTFATINQRFDEVWWFFPSKPITPAQVSVMRGPQVNGTVEIADIPKECDSYVALNTLDGTWHMGKLQRSAMIGNSAFNLWIYGTDSEGALFDHERGISANGAPMGEYLETYDLDLPTQSGAMYSLVKAFVPDFPVFEGDDESAIPTDPEIKVILKGRAWSQRVQVTEKAMMIATDQRIVKGRLRARQIAIRFEGTDNITNWRAGPPRLDIQPDGER